MTTKQKQDGNKKRRTTYDVAKELLPAVEKYRQRNTLVTTTAAINQLIREALERHHLWPEKGA